MRMLMLWHHSEKLVFVPQIKVCINFVVYRMDFWDFETSPPPPLVGNSYLAFSAMIVPNDAVFKSLFFISDSRGAASHY